MRLRSFTTLEQFLKPLDRCKGQILLVSHNGDTFNLNSKLTQLYTFNRLLGETDPTEYELICSEKEDEEYLRSRVFI